jgi:hypothetical protein
MVSLADLWLPILLSSVFVFVVSSIIHMVFQYHNSDYGKLPGEDKVLEAMRNQGVQPGEYSFPRPESMKEMSSPEMVEKFQRGPVGFLAVMPSRPPNMAKSLVLWFLYSLLVAFFVGYIARLGLGRGAEYMTVFRVTGTTAILGYAVGYLPNAIWSGSKWGNVLKSMFDGVIYGLVTAGTFGWLWPGPVGM